MRRTRLAAGALAVALPAIAVGVVLRVPAADPAPRNPAAPAPKALADVPAATTVAPPADRLPAPSTTAIRASRPDIQRVGVVGDSLSEGAEAAMEEVATRLGFEVATSAVTGRRIPEAIGDLSRMAQTVELVVVALGTNDAADRRFRPDEVDELVGMALAAVPRDVPVLWVNVWRPPGTAARRDADAMNAALEGWALQGRLEVLDWAAVVDARPELAGRDGVHLTDAGYAERAEFIADAVAARFGAAAVASR